MFINFWIEDCERPDPWLAEQILGDEDFIHFPTKVGLESLAKEAGVFGSSSDARRNGLRGPIPWGLHAWGTKTKRFWTFRPRPLEGVAEEVVVQAKPEFDKTVDMLGP